MNLFQQKKKKKKAPNIILGRTRMYIHLYRKVGLLSRTEKRCLWLAEVNFHNCLSIIYMYTQSTTCSHQLLVQYRASRVRLFGLQSQYDFIETPSLDHSSVISPVFRHYCSQRMWGANIPDVYRAQLWFLVTPVVHGASYL